MSGAFDYRPDPSRIRMELAQGMAIHDPNALLNLDPEADRRRLATGGEVPASDALRNVGEETRSGTFIVQSTEPAWEQRVLDFLTARPQVLDAEGRRLQLEVVGRPFDALPELVTVLRRRRGRIGRRQRWSWGDELFRTRAEAMRARARPRWRLERLTIGWEGGDGLAEDGTWGP